MRDFEIDKARYPYADLRIGDNTFIAHIPTLNKVYPHPVPLQLAMHVALRLNNLHHEGQREALAGIVTSPAKLWQLVHDEAHACRSKGLIDHSEYLAVQLQEV